MRSSPLSLLIAVCVLLPNAHAQQIRITPDALDFGNIPVDGIAELEFTLENTEDGTYPSVTLFSADTVHFRLHWTGERAEALRVMEAIHLIIEAIVRFRQDFDEDPGSVEELLAQGYVEMPDSVLSNWNISLIGQDPISQIEAISTNEMPYGAGHVILSDIQTGRYTGFAVPIGDPQEPLRVIEVIEDIQSAILMFRQDYGEDPSSVEELQGQEYLEIPEDLLRKWSFSLIGANPIAQIQAWSTAELIDGAGHVILYDVETDSFSGYRLPYEEFYDWLWGGEMGHGSLTLSVTFQPDEERRYSSGISVLLTGRGVEEDSLHIPLNGNGVLSVIPLPDDMPVSFKLQSVYPNPFNAVLRLSYVLPRAGRVSLQVFDVTGRPVAMLAGGYRSAGSYSVDWEASARTTGLYLVRLQAGGMRAAKKVVKVN